VLVSAALATDETMIFPGELPTERSAHELTAAAAFDVIGYSA
jgi:hypothetical protein